MFFKVLYRFVSLCKRCLEFPSIPTQALMTANAQNRNRDNFAGVKEIEPINKLARFIAFE